MRGKFGSLSPLIWRQPSQCGAVLHGVVEVDDPKLQWPNERSRNMKLGRELNVVYIAPPMVV